MNRGKTYPETSCGDTLSDLHPLQAAVLLTTRRQRLRKSGGSSLREWI